MKKKFFTIVLILSIILGPSSLFAQTAGQQSVESQTQALLNSPYNGTGTGDSGGSLATTVATNCAGSLIGSYISNLMGTYVSGMLGAAGGAIGGLFGGGSSTGGTGGGTGGGSNAVPIEQGQGSKLGGNLDATKQRLTAAETSQNLLGPIAFCVANSLVEGMTDSIVNWINSGFESPDGTKGPSFVTNPEEFFMGLADREAGGFLSALGPVGSFLCQPFDIQVRLALLDSYKGNYYQTGQCTLSSAVNNVNSFVNGNFKEGGWAGWFSLTQTDGNNPTGSYFLARQQMGRLVETRQEQGKLEVTIGRGFLNMRKCEEKDPNSGNCKKWGPITTPGAEVQATLDRALGTQAGRIQVADDFNEIISALVTKLIEMALQGISGSGSSS